MRNAHRPEELNRSLIASPKYASAPFRHHSLVGLQQTLYHPRVVPHSFNRRSVLKATGAAAAIAALDPGWYLRSSASAAQKEVSPALNQVGYLPRQSKVASIRMDPALLPAHGEDFFQVVSASDGTEVFRGPVSNAQRDTASGDMIGKADFSSLVHAGSYRLIHRAIPSGSFSVGPHVYQESLRLAMRSFYGQRCGCAVDLGDGYSHPACHAAGAFHPSSGRSGAIPNHGGWHDAGDYGRYAVNGGLTVGTLLWAWELYPQALARMQLSIPESGGHIPDYLAEVRWNLQWMLSMQDGDGGVWHKQTSEQFCAFIMPQSDTLTSYVIGTGKEPFKNTSATADMAAVMAIAARYYTPYDPQFAQRCLHAARNAWRWSVANPSVVFRNPPAVGTGEYGDAHTADELLWASAELWRTTGEPQYKQWFERSAGVDPEVQVPSWSDVQSMAYWSYLLCERPGMDTLRRSIQEQTHVAAQALVARHTSNGYGNTMQLTDYVWGSNAVAANQSLLLLISYRLHADTGVLEAALGNLHYLLGCNCFGVSWVTHVGTNPFLRPHHRPSAADGIPAPWPGLLSGGPNARPGDAVARTLPPLPPMRCWIDDERAYSLNEIAINWNAPLVFLLAAANTLAT